MNIKILDSWLRDYLKTKATPQQLAEKLSLSSVSVEKIEKFGKNDLVYDIEVTTNRPELMSVVGLAREATAVLNQNGIKAEFSSPNLTNVPNLPKSSVPLTIKNDPNLVNRVCAVVMDITIKQSPQKITDRLESTDIRSLNNVIDVTNYVMRVIGHPTHVFDYDKLSGHVLNIRESQRGQTIETLDKKSHILPGGDIVAVDGNGTIVDLLGIMGLENSVVSDQTKRILFFVNNTEPTHVRKTSMHLGIRTDAAVINEKGIDPEQAMDALLYGISLFKELADAKIVSEVVDIYPNKVKSKTVSVTEEQINKVIGVKIPLQKSADILESLGFETKIITRNPVGVQNIEPLQIKNALQVTPPSFRAKDIEIPEDIIEEIARVYGYHNIPNKLPAATAVDILSLEKNEFYWENRIKDALKYWGFTEVYTYPMVSENMYEGSLNEAVTIQNPLSEELTYMRCTLIPSLLKVVRENPDHETMNLFEIANIYEKKSNNLPLQTIKLAGVVKKPKVSFFEIKGVIEQLLTDLEINHVTWKPLEGGQGASIYVNKEYLGDIEILDDHFVDFELNFRTILKHATLNKTYKSVSKYPPIVEDLALIAPADVTTGEIIDLIKKQSSLITEVSLLDKYKDTRTFHVIYQSHQKNLTNEEVGDLREKILKTLREKLNARLKE